MSKATQIAEQSQSDNFKQAACKLERNPDEKRWANKMYKSVKPKLEKTK